MTHALWRRPPGGATAPSLWHGAPPGASAGGPQVEFLPEGIQG